MATKEQKQNKNFAEKLLQIKGIDYEEWLDERHLEVIQANQALILEALESKLNIKTSPAKPVNSNSNNNSNNGDSSTIKTNNEMSLK